MKLLSLKIHNFQKWEDFSIDFTDGVNAIIAPTDSGKSAIFRALQWVMFNKFSPNSLRRKLEDDSITSETWVKLSIEHNSEKHIIERYVDNKSSYYKLDDECFKALNRKVPEKIQALLRMDDLNIQTQYDPPFLVTSTSGDISKTINEMVGLVEMDLMTQELNTKMKTCINSEESLEREKLELESDLASFGNLSDCESDYDKANSLYEKISNLNEKRLKIDLNVSSIQKINSDISVAKEKLKIKNFIRNVEEKINTKEEQNLKLKKLENLIRNINNYKVINIPDTSDIENKFITYNQINATRTSISKLTDSIITVNENLKNCINKLNDVLKEFNQIKVCPTCGKPLES